MNSNKNTLSPLNMRPTSKLILQALSKLGRSPAADIAAYINKPKPSVYDGLSELAQMGLVIEEGEDKAKVFALSNELQIKELREKQVLKVKDAYDEILKLAQEGDNHIVARPRVRFYVGPEGIRQAFRDMQWNSKNKDAYLMWPMRDMLDTLGEDFLKHHSEGRFKHNVTIHSIRKDTDRSLTSSKHEWLKSDIKETLRNVRYAAKETQWNMSFWCYGDQTLFAGSGSESFALMVKSRDFTDLMISLWKQAWLQASE